MTPRVVVPGFPHHVRQRGHNRQVVFAHAEDYEAYLADMIELKRAYSVKLYAYCLMTNHVHLLLAPDTSSGMSLMMKCLAGRHTVRRNRRDGRTGTLWGGRYGSSVVDTERYLMICCRYIEQNPVRAKIVGDPLAYRWSSCAARLSSNPPAWLDPDPCYLAMGRTDAERQATYRAFLNESLSDAQLRLVRDAVRSGQLTGDPDFGDDIAKRTGRNIERRGPGRPPKRPKK